MLLQLEVLNELIVRERGTSAAELVVAARHDIQHVRSHGAAQAEVLPKKISRECLLINVAPRIWLFVAPHVVLDWQLLVCERESHFLEQLCLDALSRVVWEIIVQDVGEITDC